MPDKDNFNCVIERVPASFGIDCRNLNEYPELYPTLQAKPNGGQSLNFSGAVRVQYIVRRLTPTECARLQGFADRWGDVKEKDSLTPEEFRFWHDVRNTHAAINGKKVQDYTEAQILTWYNKLHTDSAEYKMWGNGIALPPALYCMQGIVDALNREEEDEEAWWL
jgi:DNA (cytosine-5)-methyltransferase 1